MKKEELTKRDLEKIGKSTLGKNADAYFEYLSQRDRPSCPLLKTHLQNYKDKFEGLTLGQLTQFYDDLKKLGIVRKVGDGRYEWLFHPRSVGLIYKDKADELERIPVSVSVPKNEIEQAKASGLVERALESQKAQESVSITEMDGLFPVQVPIRGKTFEFKIPMDITPDEAMKICRVITSYADSGGEMKGGKMKK